MNRKLRYLPPLLLAAGVAIVACSTNGSATNPANFATSGEALTQADVDRIIVNAVSQANATNLPAVVAVTDREGEVLGVFVMKGRDLNGDGIVDALSESDIQTAISKAATAAAFQSEQEAFTTRTAFFIVQGHYPPNVDNTAGGPLFGVQDSGQPSSDGHVIAFDSSGTACGTGVSGVLGGLPLYKNNSPVGGIGVSTVAVIVSQALPTDPTLAPTLVNGVQKDVDEIIARAGTVGFETPFMIQATNIFVDGIGFPFVDTTPPVAAGGIAPTTTAIAASVGAIDPRYPVRASSLAPEMRVGSQYGIRANQRYIGRVVARASSIFSGTFTNVDRPASVTYDTATFRWGNVPILASTPASLGGTTGELRNPPIDGVEPPPSEGGLTAADVQNILANAAANALTSVAGIRLPRGTNVVLYTTVVDARGNLLGAYRMGDATQFSFDISVQKARTAAFFSSDGSNGVPPLAISARAIGFLAQPYFPPGISNTEPGPLVRLRDLVNRGKITEETPPSLTLINPPPRPPSDGTTDENVLLGAFQRFNDFPAGAPAQLRAIRGALALAGGVPILADRPDVNFVSPGIQNGIQTFPGGVPLFRNGKLVGAVACSGDGVDEDDQGSFAGATGFQPPAGTRCDEVNEATIVQVLSARVGTIVAAILAHPDARIRNVYGPIVQAEQAKINDRFTRGLQGVRIPYVKFSRNPTDR